jgi:electron transfer flavoprotein alpha subunit
MPAADARRFYALVALREGDTAADYAPLSLARQLADRCGGTAHAVLVAASVGDAATRVAESGVDHAWIVPAGPEPLQPHQLTDAYAAALRTPDLSAGLDRALLLVAARPENEECAGLLAARIGATPLGRCGAFEIDGAGDLRATRTAYGGRLEITLTCNSGPAIAAVRAQLAPTKPIDAPATRINELAPLASVRETYPVTAVPRGELHAGLDGARIVVSGGRGSGEAAFPLLFDLADKLGGAVGASLPAVDAGWAPVARQVGQSGKYVSPAVYLAVGISGTPQHLAGIDPHTRIAAVNRDAEAPIFGVAEIGAVAEWQELLPALLEALDSPPLS